MSSRFFKYFGKIIGLFFVILLIVYSERQVLADEYVDCGTGYCFSTGPGSGGLFTLAYQVYWPTYDGGWCTGPENLVMHCYGTDSACEAVKVYPSGGDCLAGRNGWWASCCVDGDNGGGGKVKCSSLTVDKQEAEPGEVLTFTITPSEPSIAFKVFAKNRDNLDQEGNPITIDPVGSKNELYIYKARRPRVGTYQMQWLADDLFVMDENTGQRAVNIQVEARVYMDAQWSSPSAGCTKNINLCHKTVSCADYENEFGIEWYDECPEGEDCREVNLKIPIEGVSEFCEQETTKTCYTTNKKPKLDSVEIIPASDILASRSSFRESILSKFFKNIQASEFTDSQHQFLGYASDHHSGRGLGFQQGGGVNNPVGLKATYSDPEGFRDIQALYVWWNPSTTKTFSTPTLIDDSKEIQTDSNKNFGFMILRDEYEGDFNSIYLPSIVGSEKAWVKAGQIDDEVNILGTSSTEMVKLSDFSISETGNRVELELILEFLTIDDIVDTAEYNIWALVNDSVGFIPEWEGEESAEESVPSIVPDDDSLVAYWDLQESSGSGAYLLDKSGNGNHATPVGTSPANGKIGNGRYFSGRTIEDRIVKNTFSNFPTKAITTEFWIKTVSIESDGILSYASSSEDNDWTIYKSKSLRTYRDKAVEPWIGVNDNKWHHVAVTWKSSGGELKVYKDGDLKYSGTLAPGTSISRGGTLMLGQEQDSMGGELDIKEAFGGLLDEVAIYNRVLTATEIKERYEEGLQGGVNTEVLSVQDNQIINDADWTISGETWTLDMVQPVIGEKNLNFEDTGESQVTVNIEVHDDEELSYLRLDACKSGIDEPSDLDNYNLQTCDSFSGEIDNITNLNSLLGDQGDVRGLNTKSFSRRVNIDLGDNSEGAITFHLFVLDKAGNIKPCIGIYKLEQWATVKDGLVFGLNGVTSSTREVDVSKWNGHSVLEDFRDSYVTDIDLTNQVLLGAESLSSIFLRDLVYTNSNLSFSAANYPGLFLGRPYQELKRAYKKKAGDNIDLIPIGSTLTGGLPTDCTTEYCILEGSEDLLIDEFVCDGKALIAIDGNVTIQPNLTNDTNQDACIILASGDIEIGYGDRVTVGETPGYDIIETFLIAGGKIDIPSQTSYDPRNDDGLYVEGGLVSFTPPSGSENRSSVYNQREILFSNMGIYPVLVVDNNSKYGMLSRALFGSQIDIYKTEVGFKPY
jgi:hypothetical protein